MRLKRISLFCLFLLLAVVVQTVWAHAVPVASYPEANDVLDRYPEQISIEFNEPVVPNLSRIDLLTQAGDKIETSAITAVAENTTLMVDVLEELEQGAYLVSWQVLSGVDGHTTSGTFSFGVGVEALTVSDNDALSVQVSPFSVAARWLMLTAVSLLMGFFVFRLLVWNPLWKKVEQEPEDEQLDLKLAHYGIRIANVALALVALSLIFTFFNQNQTYDLMAGNNLGTWLSTRFGTMWLARFLISALLLFVLLIPIDLDNGRDALKGWGWWLGLLLTIALASTISMVSHSAALTENSLQVMLVDFAHVLAATMWVGGLFFLAVSLWLARSLANSEERSWLYLSLVLNFSGLAALAVGTLALSGTYLAWTHIGTWTKLVGTAYGLALLAKLGVALLTFLFAGLNLFYIKPRLNKAYESPDAPQSATAVKRTRILVTCEVVGALLILFVTGILTDLQRGVDAPLLADAPGQTTVSEQVDDLTIAVTLTPALVGNNIFDIAITDEAGNPVLDIDEVTLRFTFLGQSIGSTQTIAKRVADGLFQVEGSYISLIGTWQMEVSIQRPDQFDTFAAYRLEAGVGGNIRALDSGIRPLESVAKFMTLAGGGGTGILLILFAIMWGIIAVKAAKNEWQLIPLLVISLIAFWLGTTQLLTFYNEDFTPAKFANNPMLPDVESIAIGQALFNDNCVPCHGLAGRGDGPVAASLSPPPADFASGHTDTHPDGDLYYWILKGIEDTQMPPWEDKLSTEEVWHLVNYVRRLAIQGAAAGKTYVGNE